MREKWKEVYANINTEFKETSELLNICRRLNLENFGCQNSQSCHYENNQRYNECSSDNKKSELNSDKNKKIIQLKKVVKEDDDNKLKQQNKGEDGNIQKNRKEVNNIINPDIEHDNYFDYKNNDLNNVIYVSPVKNKFQNRMEKPYVANVDKKLIPEEKSTAKSNYINIYIRTCKRSKTTKI